MTPDTAWQEAARQMNDCAYLFAVDIRETAELTLNLHIVEAKPQDPILIVDEADPMAFLKLGGQLIEEDETCRQFHLVFDRRHMVSYTISNESYSMYPAATEVFTGRLFRSFSKSQLLDYVLQTTHYHAIHNNAPMHFEIVCGNHVIDVVCTAPPSISLRPPLQGSRVDK